MNKYLSIALLSIAALTGCEKLETKSTWDLPDKDRLAEHGQMLQAVEAQPDQQLLNTPKPSNVSPNMAITKILQALNSYDGESEFPLNTVFTVNRINEVVVRGKKYYAGLCEFDFRKENGADITALYGKSPCIGLVDAEDRTAPAIIRTANAQGEPYSMAVHFESHQNGFLDEFQIRKFLNTQGFTNLKTLKYEISKPNVEFDEDWNPYLTASWLADDAVGVMGTAYYPLAFILVNLQTNEVKGFSMDNPITQGINEGNELRENVEYTFDKIPTWVDWVYSRRLIMQMATHAGYEINNYGKRALMNQEILDGTRVNDSVEICAYGGCASNPNQVIETSKSRNGRDMIMTMFYTSRSNDLAVNRILQVNARTGKAMTFSRKGSQKGMTVKSAVSELIGNASLMRGHYDIEDLTLNPIFGKLTWQAIITRNLHDNEGNNTTQTNDSSTFYSEKDISYSVYAMTCLMEASNDIDLGDLVCHKDEDTVYTMYRDMIYKKESRAQRSTVLKDMKVTGTVIKHTVIGQQIVIRLAESDKIFIVTVDNVFDKEVGEAVSLVEGDKVEFHYGDQKNLKKVPVRLVRIL